MVGKVERQEFERYLLEARSWETSRVKSFERSKDVAWMIAGVAVVVAVLAVGAVMMLTPLKTVEPFIVRVDNATGIVDVVKGLANGNTNYEEALNKYFTQRYVRWREGYSRPLAAEYYNNVGMMSARSEQDKYLRFFSPKNPNSPLNLYKENGVVNIKVKSTSFISPNVALVRYLREVSFNGGEPSVTHWAATVIFQYVGTPMSEKDREVNPLGFQVIEYRNDPDQPVSESASAPGIPVSAARGDTLFAQPSAKGPEVPAIKPVR